MLTDKKKRKLIKELTKLLGHCSSVNVGNGGYLSVDVGQSPINYSSLKKVAELLQTDKIDVEAETRNDGYCETCSFEYSVNVLTIRDWKYE